MHPLDYARSLEANFKERFSKQWYSTIEIAPGEMTPGFGFANIALTRTLLSRAGLKGFDCADVTAVDGWAPILMCRRGAKRVAAFDRNDFSPLINQVREKLGIDFGYFPLVRSPDIPEVAAQAGFDGFDLVVNSGLLYHVLGPINTLAATRSLVKTGGILIVETATDIKASDYSMKFNGGGVLNKNDPTTFWYISPKMFEYMLRMFRLQPIDMAYLSGGRMAIACRAVDNVPAPADDEWLPKTYMARDILDLTDWSILDKRTEGLEYDAPAGLPASSGGGIDVWETVQKTEPNPGKLVPVMLSDEF